MSEPVWRVKEITWVDQPTATWIKEMGFSGTVHWLYYRIADHREEDVEMSVTINSSDGSIYSVLITTKRDSYLFFGSEAESFFDFVERELLGSDYRDDRCDIMEEVSEVDNS